MDKDSGPYSVVITRASESATDSTWESIEVNEASRGQLNLSMQSQLQDLCLCNEALCLHQKCIDLLCEERNRSLYSQGTVSLLPCFTVTFPNSYVYMLCFLRCFKYDVSYYIHFCWDFEDDVLF